jgi:NADH:ubiquinone oxidoreductase subunit F (NADH-binding)
MKRTLLFLALFPLMLQGQVQNSKMDEPEFGITTTEFAVEYNETYTQYRKVKKVYSGGILTEKIPGEWKQLKRKYKSFLGGLE